MAKGSSGTGGKKPFTPPTNSIEVRGSKVSVQKGVVALGNSTKSEGGSTQSQKKSE